MANKKRRCTSCKKYKEADKGIVCPVGFFCNSDCRFVYANTKTKSLLVKSKSITKKVSDKEYSERKRKFKLSDLKIRKAAAVKSCHAYIKARDLGKPCITCNRHLVGKYDSGHFLKAGNHPYTRFMEKNIHSQCVNCNQYNGGREKEYKEVLIIKYGPITVRALEKLRSKKITRTASDYLAIENHYKQKLKSIT